MIDPGLAACLALGAAAFVSGWAALATDRRLRQIHTTRAEQQARRNALAFRDRLFVRLFASAAQLVPLRWIGAPTAAGARLLRQFYTYVLITWCCGALAAVLALELLV